MVEQRMREICSGRGFPRSIYHWQQLSGVPQSTFYAVMKERREPGVLLAIKLARAGGVTVEHIFGDLVRCDNV